MISMWSCAVKANARWSSCLEAEARGSDLRSVPGLVFRSRAGPADAPAVVDTGERPFEKQLDRIPFPARDLLPNAQYIQHTRGKYGYSITSVMTTRGCPFRCEFCSNVVFGGSYRQRSPINVVDEIEAALALGYDRISFADDVFTLNKERVLALCLEIAQRGLHFHWECLGRVDALDAETAAAMKRAGCTRNLFGIESADEGILQIMQKRITPAQARLAVEVAHTPGLRWAHFHPLLPR